MRNVVEIEKGDGYCILRLFGELDAGTLIKARPLIASKIPAACNNFIVDLGLVSFLDSHGVGFSFRC